MSIPVSTRRLNRSKGNAMLESSFTLLPCFALLLGFVNFGLAVFRWTTLQNAVREGCRYAITFQTKTGLGQDASIEQTVQNYAMGLVSTSDSPQDIFVSYYAPTALTTPIVSGGNVPGNVVRVSVQNYNLTWIAPLLMFSPSFQVNVYSYDILGGYPVGVTGVAE